MFKKPILTTIKTMHITKYILHKYNKDKVIPNRLDGTHMFLQVGEWDIFVPLCYNIIKSFYVLGISNTFVSEMLLWAS
jgi:hypothetical protein